MVTSKKTVAKKATKKADDIKVVADPVTTETPSAFDAALAELKVGISKKGVLNRKKLMAAMRKRGFKITLKDAAKYLA